MGMPEGLRKVITKENFEIKDMELNKVVFIEDKIKMINIRN